MVKIVEVERLIKKSPLLAFDSSNAIISFIPRTTDIHGEMLGTEKVDANGVSWFCGE